MTGPTTLDLLDFSPVGSQGKPFEADPNACMLIRNATVERVVDTLMAGIHRHDSLMALTGESGTGKTLLLSWIIDCLAEDYYPVQVSGPCAKSHELIGSICAELGLTAAQSDPELKHGEELRVLRDYLAQQKREGHFVTIFIDDAQDIPESVLAELMILLKVDEAAARSAQIVLSGLPELEAVLSGHRLRAVTPRDFQICRLAVLRREEVGDFIAAQLSALDGVRDDLFEPGAIAAIASASHGIPRQINAICRLAIAIARRENLTRITAELIPEIPKLFLPGSANASEPMDVPADLGARRVYADNPPVAPMESTVRAFPSPANDTLTKATMNPAEEKETVMSRVDNLNKILKDLQNESPGVEASALISEDGLMIASALPQNLDETRVGGMTATLLNLGTRAAVELGRGDVKEVIVRGDEGYAVMISAGRGVLMLVLANENAKLGLIFFDMREAINAIKKIL